MEIRKWPVAALALVSLLAMTAYDITSNGAPIGHTNAPGELTCNRSGCHVGHDLNSGDAILSVDLGNGQAYQPGAIHEVTVEIAQDGKERFGFQVLALKDDTTNAGTFIVTDSVRTKVSIGTNQYAGRNYMTYRFPGTVATSPGHGKWTFQWQAPSNTTSPVTFYTAAAVANNDGTDQGDYIYTKVLTLQALPTSEEPQVQPLEFSSLYPNPSTGTVNISYHSTGRGSTTIHLQNPLTQSTLQLLSRKDPAGIQHFSTDLRGSLPVGTYLIWISQGPNTQCHKLILTP